MHRGAEPHSNFLRAGNGAVRDVDARNAALSEPEHDSVRRTSGAEHERGLDPLVPARRGCVEIGEEALGVGVGGAQRALVEPQRIGCAYRQRPRVRLREREGRRLMRNGDIRADIAVLIQVLHELGELLGRHRLGPIIAGNAVGLEPVPMNEGRPRMRRRPADHAGGPHARRTLDHGSSITVLRRTPISGAAISITSPGCKKRGGSVGAPDGVPVTITSPGFSVVNRLI